MRARVWAPRAAAVTLVAVPGERPMRPAGGGWWEDAGSLAHGERYAFRPDGGDPLPDPRAVWLPDGVHAPAAAYDHAVFAWTDRGWRGRPLAGGVVYELHLGTFTPEGTLDAAALRLPYLAGLGVTHVELLPVAAFDGDRGWGYDGVGVWAVHEPYGGPDALKRFVDRAHAEGLAVVLDVVHNHLGPSGNHLARFGPYFTGRHHTPWGEALNLDDDGSDEVRAWMTGNAVSWLRDFRLDGLRLDAVHALVDDRAVHVLEELSAAVDALAAAEGRPLALIAETDRNDPRTVTPREAGGLGIHAQWDDDVHHALHALLTGERQGYYVDFGSMTALATVLTGAFLHDGRWSTFRGRSHGRPVDRARTEGWRFVASLQTHDQVGNRALGDRLSHLAAPDRLRAGAMLLLTAPFTPMLFMGEEWAASTPWRYFTSFPDPDLGRAVSEGRGREFAEHGWDGEVPDPQDEGTFAASVLRWDEVDEHDHAAMLEWYRSLIALRRAESDLSDPRLDRVRCEWDDDARWIVVHRGGFRVAVNLGDSEVSLPLGACGREIRLSSPAGAALEPDRVRLPAGGCAVVEV
ncbi:MAG: malto-oligosyltrehalose trehalohydrolase [Thermoleophilia bacterium]|nr:malto-oligosyltrehalose trehalohydrolase [Thermoleophilia bacterium]